MLFFFFFVEIKINKTQIDKLTGIATVLEAQNDTMKMHNDLIAQQVDIFRNTSILSESNGAAMNELRDIEEKKLKLSVMPKLWLNGAGYNGYEGTLTIDLNNKGENANLLEFNLISGDITLQNNYLPIGLDKGGKRAIIAKTNGKKHIKDCEYEIDIIYTDKLENKFVSKIKGKGANAKIVESIEKDI